MASKSHYDREKSRVKDDKLAQFVLDDLEEDITTVPGVGPKTADQLKAAGVETSFQLIAKFLSFRKEGATEKDVCEDTYQFLAGLGIGAFRSGITTCLLEKCKTLFPGLFEEDDE